MPYALRITDRVEVAEGRPVLCCKRRDRACYSWWSVSSFRILGMDSARPRSGREEALLGRCASCDTIGRASAILVPRDRRQGLVARGIEQKSHVAWRARRRCPPAEDQAARRLAPRAHPGHRARLRSSSAAAGGAPGRRRRTGCDRRASARCRRAGSSCGVAVALEHQRERHACAPRIGRVGEQVRDPERRARRAGRTRRTSRAASRRIRTSTRAARPRRLPRGARQASPWRLRGLRARAAAR